ncbi:MAG: branched-chain amino acid ABC transporter permease [Candidatus Rokubacteria bacterium]|nr:branched-chain amino acid ABC transporter permease [Candidatus Rokubacteria bacterium]
MRRLLAGTAVGLLALPALPSVPPYYLYLLSTAFLFATLATAWNLLAYGGQVSFGHAGFFGLGAYAGALGSLQGLSPWLAIGLGGAVAAAGGVAVGLTSARLRGASLALATLAAAELLRGLALNWTPLTGGGAGLIGIPPLPQLPGVPLDFARGRVGTYYLSLGVLAAALAIFATILRSAAGLGLAALRESEQRATLLGVRPLPWKLFAFGLSALLTGLAGSVYAHTVRAVEPDVVFNRFFSIVPLVMATFGGLYTLLGPTLAAITLYLASELLLHPYLPALHQLPYALALIVVILYLPGGLAAIRRPGPRNRGR